MEAPPKIYVTIGMGSFEKLAFKQVTEQDTPYIRLDLHEALLSEIMEKLSFLRQGCLNLDRDELIQRISAVDAQEWKAGHWLTQQKQPLAAENKRLREALGKIREYANIKEMAFRDCEPETVLGFVNAALATQPVAQEPEHHIADVGKMVPAAQEPDSIEHPVPNNHRAIEGEWREFVPSPINPTREGDQWFFPGTPALGWRPCTHHGITERGLGGTRYRRFHPATNQEDV